MNWMTNNSFFISLEFPIPNYMHRVSQKKIHQTQIALSFLQPYANGINVIFAHHKVCMISFHKFYIPKTVAIKLPISSHTCNLINLQTI